MKKVSIPCHPANYGGIRREPIRFIVIHYTAGDGDTARNNGIYFQREETGTSAHWFVDETDCLLSVPEEYVAWHCGGISYVHPECRNGNSIGIELCSRKDQAGRYYFAEETLVNAAALVRELLKTYGLQPDAVLRHYDVTGKKCPAPFVEAGVWEEFRRMLVRYDSLEMLPEWAKDTIGKLMEQGILQGDGQGLDLSHDMVRILVLLDRSGLFG